jgi:hypothetical protein
VENSTHNTDIRLLPRVETCLDCAEPFVIAESERQWYLDRKMKEPKRCASCRQRRRRAKEAQQPSAAEAGKGGADNG